MARRELEDFLVDRDGFQLKAFLKEKPGGLVVGVDRFRVGPALDREVPDGVVHIGIIGGFVEQLAPYCDGLGILTGVRELAGALDRRFLLVSLIRSHAHSLTANNLA